MHEIVIDYFVSQIGKGESQEEYMRTFKKSIISTFKTCYSTIQYILRIPCLPTQFQMVRKTGALKIFDVQI